MFRRTVSWCGAWLGRCCVVPCSCWYSWLLKNCQCDTTATQQPGDTKKERNKTFNCMYVGMRCGKNVVSGHYTVVIKGSSSSSKKKEEKNNNNIYCSAESNTNIYLYSFAAHSLKTNISALFA